VGRDQPDDWDPAFDDAFEVTWTVATKPPWRLPREGTRSFLPEAVANGGDSSSDFSVGGGQLPVRVHLRRVRLRLGRGERREDGRRDRHGGA
jgi:hypothetical protein